MSDWFARLFINEAKPALKRHSNGGGNDAETTYNAGYAAGQQAEYDRFWDAYQQNGKRTNYFGAFHREWTDEAFQPKYNITPKTLYGSQMFQNSLITDLKDKLDALGVKLDTSECYSLTQTFQSAKIKHIPTLDLRLATQLGYTFGTYCEVITIDKLLVSETTAFQNSTFDTANWLKNITLEGTIGVSINFQWSPLSVESMKSVISALKNFTGTGNEHTQTVKFSDACWTTLEEDSAAPDGGTWKDYVETALCWNT